MGTASYQRYAQSERCAASRERKNKRRIFVGERYHSSVSTAADAQRINAHIKERRIAFSRQQSGTET